MRSLFLSPHADDETLFGAFTLIAHKPRVIIVLTDNDPRRAAESGRAITTLGCIREQWNHPETAPNQTEIEQDLRALADEEPWERVYAPRIEAEDGNWHHNMVASIAGRVFAGRVVHYLTYTAAGKSTDGTPVPYLPGWVALKLRAMAAYESQSSHPSHAPHFVRGLEEFYA